MLIIGLTLGNPSFGLWYATVATIGSVLGGALGYAIGLYGGRPIAKKIMGQERMDLVHDYFQKYEAWAILIAGFTPVPYKIFTIGAGAFYVDFKTFMVASVISRGARFFLVAGAIQLVGPWMKEFIESYFNLFSIVFMVLLVLGFWVVRHQSKKLNHTPSP